MFNKRQLLALIASFFFAIPAFATVNVAPGYLSNNARTQGDMKTAFEQMILFMNEGLGAAAETTLMISGSAVTPTVGAGNIFKIDTSGGAANLDNIVATNVPDGRCIIIRCANPGSNPVTVRHNQAGSLPILMADSANFVFASSKEWLVLKRTSTNFEEIGRFYGDQVSGFRTYLGLGTAAVVNTGTSGANVPTVTQADARYAALAGSSSQAFNVAGSPTSNNAVNKTVADATYAALAGSSGQTFSVAAASSANHAVNKTYGDGHYLASVQRFVSTDQAFTLGSTGAVPHSLGSTPVMCFYALVNVTTEGGYVTGDTVFGVSNGGTGGQGGISVWADGTNISYSVSNNSVPVTNKTTGAAVSIAPAKWKIRLFALL